MIACTLLLPWFVSGSTAGVDGLVVAKIEPPRFELSVLPEASAGLAHSRALAVNERGQCVGRLDGSTFPFEILTVFWDAPDAPPVIATGPGSDVAIPADINSSGLVVGTAAEGLAAFTWRPGSDIEWLPDSGLCCPGAEAVDDFGAVAGFSVFEDRGPVATLWRHGSPENLGLVAGADLTSRVNDMNEAGLMVGSSGNHAARFTRQGAERLELPGATFSIANGVNALGDAVGEALFGLPSSQAILWTGRVGDVLPTLGGDYASAQAINAHGWIVGYSDAAPLPGVVDPRAALWIGGVAFDLNRRTVGLPPDVLLVSADDVNDAGQIVGTAVVAGAIRAFFLDPIPATDGGQVDPGPIEDPVSF
jgi:hypothetical protein